MQELMTLFKVTLAATTCKGEYKWTSPNRCALFMSRATPLIILLFSEPLVILKSVNGGDLESVSNVFCNPTTVGLSIPFNKQGQLLRIYINTLNVPLFEFRSTDNESILTLDKAKSWLDRGIKFLTAFLCMSNFRLGWNRGPVRRSGSPRVIKNNTLHCDVRAQTHSPTIVMSEH